MVVLDWVRVYVCFNCHFVVCIMKGLYVGSVVPMGKSESDYIRMKCGMSCEVMGDGSLVVDGGRYRIVKRRQHCLYDYRKVSSYVYHVHRDGVLLPKSCETMGEIVSNLN